MCDKWAFNLPRSRHTVLFWFQINEILSCLLVFLLVGPIHTNSIFQSFLWASVWRKTRGSIHMCMQSTNWSLLGGIFVVQPLALLPKLFDIKSSKGSFLPAAKRLGHRLVSVKKRKKKGSWQLLLCLVLNSNLTCKFYFLLGKFCLQVLLYSIL